MAGIYLHIPFCHKACIYCDFHFSTSMKYKKEMVKAICQEIDMRKDFLGGAPIETVYFGGGTPSVLDTDELYQIFERLDHHFTLSPTVETTLEANPEDLTMPYLTGIQEIGINRLSIGIQSFQDEILTWMNRNHNAMEARECVERAKKVGILNISIDLIFGSPQLSNQYWEEDIRKAVELDIPHLSVYSLTVENQTALAHQIKKGLVRIPEDQTYAEQFLYAHHLLEEKAYNHYELSNYALEGFHSRHNSSYWQQIPYLGLGPSAHSFDGKKRLWNIANNAHYLRQIAENRLPIEDEEELNKEDKYHEHIMTGLRQKKGIDAQYIYNQFGIDIRQRFESLLKEWERKKLMNVRNENLHLTPKGWLISDQLISELFLT